MQSNKQKWAERHAKGMTKLDVATEVAIASFTGELQEKTDRLNKKKKKIIVDPAGEAQNAQDAATTDITTEADTPTTDAADATIEADTEPQPIQGGTAKKEIS